MMIPEVGSMPKVSGSSIATPEGGPTPGSAPISMPTITPHTAMKMLNGVSATPKPIARLPRKSIGSERPEKSLGQRHVQPVREDEPVEAGGRDRDYDRQRPRVALQV